MTFKPQCKICFEEDGNLISPCACKGYLGFVHSECLLQWMEISGRRECEICLEELQVSLPVQEKLEEKESIYARFMDAIGSIVAAAQVTLCFCNFVYLICYDVPG